MNNNEPPKQYEAEIIEPSEHESLPTETRLIFQNPEESYLIEDSYPGMKPFLRR